MFTPDWAMTGTQQEIEAELRGFKLRVGWTESATDTTYVHTEGNGQYHVLVWNYPDTRKLLMAALKMPVHKA